ncbi:uncharacterized protein LOC144040427 isoform X2 [Vanacampus margaritifer]
MEIISSFASGEQQVEANGSDKTALNRERVIGAIRRAPSGRSPARLAISLPRDVRPFTSHIIIRRRQDSLGLTIGSSSSPHSSPPPTSPSSSSSPLCLVPRVCEDPEPLSSDRNIAQRCYHAETPSPLSVLSCQSNKIKSLPTCHKMTKAVVRVEVVLNAAREANGHNVRLSHFSGNTFIFHARREAFFVLDALGLAKVHTVAASNKAQTVHL